MSLPYLRKVKGSYEVSFLGRNGEPAAKKKVSIRMKHALADQKSAHLITDKQGTVKLGELYDVQEVLATMDSCPHESRCQWSLQHSNSGGSSQWSYPRGPISVLEGDSVELPICLRQGETKL